MANGPPARREHPIAAGLIALIGVAVVVGLILGGGAFAAAKVLGLDNGADASAGSSASQTLYIPSGTASDQDSDPGGFSIAPDTSGPSVSIPPASGTPSARAKAITLVAGSSTVGEMSPINLDGSYPGGEGAILDVQQFTAGRWSDFYAVSASVTGGRFQTFVQTGIAGKHRFRVFDSDAGIASNPITVTVG